MVTKSAAARPSLRRQSAPIMDDDRSRIAERRGLSGVDTARQERNSTFEFTLSSLMNFASDSPAPIFQRTCAREAEKRTMKRSATCFPSNQPYSIPQGMMQARQMELSFSPRSGRGGARLGAGRKPLPPRMRHTPHRARPVQRAAHPVHITLRSLSRSLRNQFVMHTVLRAFRDSNSNHFRIVHYSVQDNHVHIIVEAESGARLSSGVRGLMVRVARRVNRLLFRRGQFWADRWHGRALTNPRQVRNALVYVLQNHRKHARIERAHSASNALDPRSSAEWFDGFRDPLPSAFRSIGPPSIVLPRTWLLRTGWQRGGRIRFWEAPKGPSPKRT
jgi:REP element-mobilizing transposase RayT